MRGFCSPPPPPRPAPPRAAAAAAAFRALAPGPPEEKPDGPPNVNTTSQFQSGRDPRIARSLRNARYKR